MQKSQLKEKHFWAEKIILVGILLLLPNSGYLIAFAENSFFYMLNVFLHVGLGLALLIPAIIYGRRLLAKDVHTGKELAMFAGHLGFWACVAGVVAALYLLLAGNRKESEWILYAHVVFCFFGVVFLTTAIRRVGHQISVNNRYDTAGRWLLIFTVIGVCIPILVHTYRFLFVHYDERIHNPTLAPATMEAEAVGGAQGPFFPSSAATTSGDTIPVSFITNAAACGVAGCHTDIYKQWRSSPHAYAGFENLWYRTALTQTETQAGNVATKWCAGCHTPAALLSGVANLPVAAQAQTKVAHAGVTCTSCHAVVDVRGTMGQGGYVIEQPGMFSWLVSEDAWKNRIFAWFVHLDSQPHRKAFLQPFHQAETGAFCSSCHKGHVDRPLNNASWLQVMNDYDSWQSSSLGLGGRDYVRPPARKDCAACHMPPARARDAGATAGKASDHRFLGANTWLPMWQNDEERLRATIAYLQDNRITLDIFALSLSQSPRRKPQLMSADSSGGNREKAEPTGAVKNDEEEWSLQRVVLTPQGTDSLIAPLSTNLPRLSAGQSFRLDVVVRSREVGHYFPAGAADMAQAWLELKIVDERGKIIFWSGAARGEHQEEVDRRAHFYGIHAVDSAGVRTHHPESWKTQAAFANLLPPNSAEVVRYRVQLPTDCGTQLHFLARLNYRKYDPQAFSRQHAQVAGSAPPATDSTLALIQKTTVLPIVEMARAEMSISLQGGAQQGSTADHKMLATRWQDYGVGLLRQHDLAAAELAFLQADSLTPNQIDIWINLGIIKLRLGQTDAAKKLFAKALELEEDDPRAHYCLAMALKAEGNYAEALAHVKSASSVVRRDREFHLELGRLHYLLENIRYSKQAFKRVIHIDPENPVTYEDLIRTYKIDKNKEANIAQAEQLSHRFRKNERMRALEQQARTQAAWPDTSNTFYHEYHSAGPEFWQAEDASNGHHVSTTKH